MKKPNLTRLEHDERLREFRYHIRGIVEATENVIDLIANLNTAYERDADAFATMTSRLEVEALDHLGYHVKSLRTPLRRLQREAYARLEDNGKSISPRTRKRSAKVKAKTPARPRRATAAASRAKR
jgi:hypothetical protein